MTNQVAVVMRQAPYGSVYTAEGLRTLLGIAVFEMDISVVFCDDGVYALVRNQDPNKLEMKPLGDAFPSLADFGVTRFYVHDESLAERGLTPSDLVMEAQIVDAQGLAEVLAQAGQILPF